MKQFFSHYIHIIGFWLLATLIFFLQKDTQNLFTHLNQYFKSNGEIQILERSQKLISQSTSQLVIGYAFESRVNEAKGKKQLNELLNTLGKVRNVSPQFNKAYNDEIKKPMEEILEVLNSEPMSKWNEERFLSFIGRLQTLQGKLQELNQSSLDTNKFELTQVGSKEADVKNDFYIFYAFFTLTLFGLAYLARRNRISQLALQTSETLHRYLLGSLSEGILVCLNDGRVVINNRNAEVILGYEKGDLKGCNITDLFPMAVKEDGTIFERSDSPIKKLVERNVRINNLILGIYDPDGSERWIMMNSQPIYDMPTGSQISAIVSFFDVTEKILQQRDLEKQQLKVISSSRMATLGEMASGMAHEINNPLSIIQFDADNLMTIASKLSDEDHSNRVMKIADDIERTVSRISKIISGTLKFARDGSKDDVSEVSVKGILEETERLCRHKVLRSSVALTIEPLDPDIQIRGRETQLTQAVLNLVSNAVDAVEKLPDRWVFVSARDCGGTVEISITDSGSGIPIEVQKQIFQPFFTTKSIGSGTGIGMSITREIIENHKGQIIIDNDSKNTKFVVRLPKDMNKIDMLPPLKPPKAS